MQNGHTASFGRHLRASLRLIRVPGGAAIPGSENRGGVSEYSAWLEAPIVVSGSLKGVRAYGAQERTVRSAGLGPHIGVLYWCTAALTIQHVLKGPSALRGITRDYVWADIEPGCRSGRRAIARQNRELSIWFVRQDGLLLRPQNDFGMPTHFSIRTPDSGRKAAMTPTGLGLALLTPTSYAGGAKEMGDSSLYTIAAMACSLLGKEACIGHLQQLVIRHPPLRGMTCAYLNEVYGMSCP